MTYLFGLLYCCLSCAHCAKPPLSEAPVAARYDSVYQHFSDQSYMVTHQVSKTILKTEGIADVSQFSLKISKRDHVKIIKAEVIQPDQTRIVLDKKAIDKRQRTTRGGLDNDQQITFLFPELKLGSTINIAWKVYGSYPYRSEQSGCYFQFLPANERVDYDYLCYKSEVPLYVRGENIDNFDLQQSDDKKTITIHQKTPRYDWYLNEPQSAYVLDFPCIAINTTEYIQDVFLERVNRWNQLLNEKLPGNMAKVVKANLSKAKEEQVIAILHYLRDNYRYLGDWRSTHRGWIPFSLSDIEKRGYGDCKDLSIALVAMLRASGIKADPIFVQRSLVAPKLLLNSVPPINHAMVRAEIEDKVWWLDPTNRSFCPDYIPRDIHNRWAIRFCSDNTVERIDIPRESSEAIEHYLESNFSFDEVGHNTMRNMHYYSKQGGLEWITADYMQGKENVTRALKVSNENAEATIKRDETDFLLAKPYGIEEIVRSKKPVLTRNGAVIMSVSANRSTLSNFIGRIQHYLNNSGVVAVHLPHGSQQVLCRFKDFSLMSSKAPTIIQSPWLDVSLTWSDTEEGCLCDVQFIRKVDWLEHDTIHSKAFKEFFEKLTVLETELVQPAVYSTSPFVRKLSIFSLKYPYLTGLAVGTVLGGIVKLCIHLSEPSPSPREPTIYFT